MSPIYDFECKSCSTSTEIFTQSRISFPIPKCPDCNKEMQQLLGLSTFRTYGSGFYHQHKKD